MGGKKKKKTKGLSFRRMLNFFKDKFENQIWGPQSGVEWLEGGQQWQKIVTGMKKNGLRGNSGYKNGATEGIKKYLV